MTTDALLSIALGVAIPFLLAVAGGILAIKALPNDVARPERWIWVGVFIFLLLVGLVLAFVQQVRMTTVQSAIEEREKQKELKSEGEIKYTQGQLDSINRVLAQAISTANGASDKSLTSALILGALKASQTRQSGVEPPAIQRMTNQQLRTKVIDFVNSLRKVTADYTTREETTVVSRDWRNLTKEEQQKAFQDQNNRIIAEMNNFDLQLQQRFVGDSSLYRDELLRRLGPQDNPPPQTWWAGAGEVVVVGYWQALGTADYLESLAKRLPQ